MILYDLPAPAKINLFLHVVGRRADGRHLLQTVFRFIDLCDYLHVESRADGQIVCEPFIEGLDAHDNLIVKAARLLQQHTGAREGAQIRCDKIIPAGGGLGGGSSNAATTLIALNHLWRTGLDRAELMRLGLLLGADVPVFIFGQAAFAKGIGEVLTPLQLPDRAYLVAEPIQKVSTKAVFSDPDLTRDTACIKISIFTDWLKSELSRYASPTQEMAQFGHNDLQPTVFARYPAVARAHAQLQNCGIHARMSGSGSCLFSEYASMQQARHYQQVVVSKINAQYGGHNRVINAAWACSGLSDHPLRHWLGR